MLRPGSNPYVNVDSDHVRLTDAWHEPYGQVTHFRQGHLLNLFHRFVALFGVAVATDLVSGLHGSHLGHPFYGALCVEAFHVPVSEQADAVRISLKRLGHELGLDHAQLLVGESLSVANPCEGNGGLLLPHYLD